MFRYAAACIICVRLLAAIPQDGTPAVPPPRLPTLAEAFEAAIRAGELEETKRLISSGANVNQRDSFGNTPLLYAAISGDTDIVACLLAHGAEVNAGQGGPPILGHNALEAAVLGRHTDVVRQLLAAGARVDGADDPDGRTTLHLAARYGEPSITELLLNAQADLKAVDASGHTALDVAVLYSQLSVVTVLLRHGADPQRVRSLDGRGALHEACIRGPAVLIDLLVSAGAPPAARDKFGQTPLDLALAYQNRAAIGALERLSAQRSDCRTAAASAMETATLRGQSEIVRLLLDGGFNPHDRTPEGSTYLHVAALKGQSKLVKLFLDRGADLHALDEAGGTPLHSAALGGSTEVINMLLDRGALIDAVDRDSGATPLMLAASVSRTEAVALLLRRGAKTNLRDHRGHTALDRARQTDDSESVKLLEHSLIDALPTLKPLV